MTVPLWSAYRAARAKRPEAHAADLLRTLRATGPTVAALRGWTGGERLAFTARGFDITVCTKPDETPDLSWIGRFTDRWAPGVLDRFHGEARGRGWRREYRYFLSCNNADVAAVARTLNRDHGYSKHAAYCAARRYRLEDCARLEDYGDGWGMVGVVVTASRHGIRLGSASLWGIESEAGPYFAEVADDLLTEAVTEARAVLGTLCQSTGGPQ